jgi:hypothetical protein
MHPEAYLDVCAQKHGGNPESVAANRRASEKKFTLRTAIYMYLRLDKPRGATCKEMAAHFIKPMHAISGRISELKAMGMIIATDELRDGGRVLVADVHAGVQMSLAI